MTNVNIHLKTPGADEAKEKFNQLGGAAKKLGDDTSQAGRRGADGFGPLEKKTSSLGRILGSLKSQILGFVAAWLGMEGIQRIIDGLISRLERMHQLQKNIYQESLSINQMGQALEYQTKTAGQQQAWSQKILALQAAGALSSPDTAYQMMVSADIALADQGGIKNPQIMGMLKDVAPFVGTGQFTGEEVAQAFEFAKTAGVPATAEGYQTFFAQLHSAYTASKSKTAGQFMSGLMQGGVSYMGLGGSREMAFGLFSAARSQIGSEAQAGTALEQLTRLSGGAYAKPIKNIEKALGVKWSDLSMDQRAMTLLQYTRSLPAAERVSKLVEAGFPAELTTVVAKLVSAEAGTTLESTISQVTAASPAGEISGVRAYMDSAVGKERTAQANRAAGRVKAGPAFAAWQRRFATAKSNYETLAAKGQDEFWVPEKFEPTYMALGGLENDILRLLKSGEITSVEDYNRAMHYLDKIREKRSAMSSIIENPFRGFMGEGLGKDLGYAAEQFLQQAQPSVTIDQSTNFNYARPGQPVSPRYSQTGEQGNGFTD